MTECKRYNMGENHYKWSLKVICYNHYDSYKYVLFADDDSEYIGTNYVTPSTANDLEVIIDSVAENPGRFENIADVFNYLQSLTYGSMFYMRDKISPQLTDGVLILANEEANKA